MQTVAAPCESFGSLGGHVARIETVAGAGVGFELRPELAQLHAFGDALPEPAQPQSERKVFRARRFSRWRSGCHGNQVIIEEEKHWLLNTAFKTVPVVR